MATVIVIQDWRDCIALLHTFLYLVICTNAAAHKCNGKGNTMDHPLRTGKDLPIWRPNDSWRRGLQTIEE